MSWGKTEHRKPPLNDASKKQGLELQKKIYFSSLINLSITQLTTRSLKCQTIVRNAKHNFPETELTFYNCSQNSPKLRGIQFTTIDDEEIQHIFTFEKMEQANVWPFYIKMTFNRRLN